jgi:chromosome segregation ATPase
MNWLLLLPSTWNPATAWWRLLHGTSGEASQALSDLFITVTVYLGATFLLWSVWLTLRSWWRASRYRRALRGVTDYAAVRQKLHTDRRVPLFRGLHHHLVEIPLRDGSEKTESRRTVEAAEVFTDDLLAPGLSSSRIFQALPGILTGLGVLGTFVGLQLGIGALDLRDLQRLETSIVPLIQGCAIAFSTSVWGVTASLGFSFIEKALEAFALGGVRKLQAQVDSLIPRYVPEEAMAELERSSRGSEELLKGLAVAIGEEMQKAIGRLGAEIKDAVVNATREGQGPLAEQSAQLLSAAITAELGNLKDTIGQMSEQFTSRFSSASDELMRSVQSFQPTVATLSQAVSDAQQTVANAVAKLNAHEAVMSQMAEAVEKLKQAAESFAKMRETLEASATRNEEAAKAQHTAATANQEVAAKFGAIGERLPEVRQTIEDAARVIGSLGAPIAELQTLLATQPELQRQIEGQRSASEEERSTRLLKLSKDLAGTVAKAVEEFAKVGSVAEQLSAASNSLNEASNELAVFGQQVLEASQEQRAASEASRDAANASERTTEALAPLPEAFADLAGGLTQAGASVKEGAESVAESYDQLVELQRLWFDGAKVGLNALKERLQEIIGSYGAQIEGQTQNLMNQWTQQVAECLKTYENQVETLEGSLEELQAAISKFQRGA